MEIAAILQLISLAVTAGPEVFNLVTKIIADVKREFKTADERLIALNAILLLLAPMEKER
jgi:hypothetical protein